MSLFDAHDMLAQLIEAQLMDAQLIELHEAEAHDMLAHDMEFHVGSFCAVVCHVSELNAFSPVSGSTEMNWSRPRFGLAVPSVASLSSIVETMPIIVPRTRNRRTRARVSMPSMPMMPSTITKSGRTAALISRIARSIPAQWRIFFGHP